MLLFLALSCLAAAAAGSVVVYQRGAANRLASPDGTARLPPRSTAPAPPPRPEATLDTLQHGDVVLDGNDDYVVVGTLAYREETEGWAMHCLDGGAQQRFLEVRKRSGVLSAALLDAVDDAPIHGQLAGGLTYRGKALTLELRGDARVMPSGEAGDRQASLLKYARYVGPGGALLVVEEEAARKRAWFGHVMPTSTLQIYPHA